MEQLQRVLEREDTLVVSSCHSCKAASLGTWIWKSTPGKFPNLLALVKLGKEGISLTRNCTGVQNTFQITFFFFFFLKEKYDFSKKISHKLCPKSIHGKTVHTIQLKSMNSSQASVPFSFFLSYALSIAQRGKMMKMCFSVFGISKVVNLFNSKQISVGKYRGYSCITFQL